MTWRSTRLALVAAAVVLVLWIGWALLGFRPILGWPRVYTLEAIALPVDGNPMAVRFTTQVRGGWDGAPGLYCDTRWGELGGPNGTGFRVGLCELWRPGRKFGRNWEKVHTFDAPGVHIVTLGRTWLRSDPIQVTVPAASG